MKRIGNGRDKLVEAQIEGLCKAYTIVKEKGIDELEKEIKFRNMTYLPLTYSREKLMDYFNGMIENIFNSIILLSMATLHDEFGFGKDRADRYLKRFMLKSACMQDREVTEVSWEDIAQQVKEDLGYDVTIDWKTWNNSSVINKIKE